MKPNRLFSLMIASLAISLSTTAFAQQNMNRQGKPQENLNEKPMHQECRNDHRRKQMEFDFLKLTDDQKDKIKALKHSHLKESMKHKAKMSELRAHLHTLSIADIADMKAIHTTIDEITQTQNQLMKLREGFKQQVRLLLTEEQRIEFDSKKEQNFRHRGMKSQQRIED